MFVFSAAPTRRMHKPCIHVCLQSHRVIVTSRVSDIVSHPAMESGFLCLPESFESLGGSSGSRRAGSARPARNALPQWLALCTVLSGKTEHAEVRMLCRATDLHENWARASPAELRECDQWTGAFRQLKRSKHVALKEFYCWDLDRWFIFDAPVRLRRDQFPGKQLQRACRPSQDLYQLLSNRPGRRLMGSAGEALLPELRLQKGWLLQVPASLSILSQTEPVSVLKLWTPGKFDCRFAHPGL